VLIGGLRADGEASSRQRTGSTPLGQHLASSWARADAWGPVRRPRASTNTIDEVVGHAARRVERSGVRQMTSASKIRDRPRARRVVATAGLWEPIATCHDGQRVEWSPRRGSRSPCMGWAKLRASSHFGPPPVRPHPDTLSPPPSQPRPPGTQKAPCGHSRPLGGPGTWAPGKAVERNVGQIRALSANLMSTTRMLGKQLLCPSLGFRVLTHPGQVLGPARQHALAVRCGEGAEVGDDGRGGERVPGQAVEAGAQLGGALGPPECERACVRVV
jgi:hypothetical protein